MAKQSADYLDVEEQADIERLQDSANLAGHSAAACQAHCDSTTPDVVSRGRGVRLNRHRSHGVVLDNQLSMQGKWQLSADLASISSVSCA